MNKATPENALIVAAVNLCKAIRKTESNPRYNYLWSLSASAYFYKRPKYDELVDDLEKAIEGLIPVPNAKGQP